MLEKDGGLNRFILSGWFCEVERSCKVTFPYGLLEGMLPKKISIIY